MLRIHFGPFGTHIFKKIKIQLGMDPPTHWFSQKLPPLLYPIISPCLPYYLPGIQQHPCYILRPWPFVFLLPCIPCFLHYLQNCLPSWYLASNTPLPPYALPFCPLAFLSALLPPCLPYYPSNYLPPFLIASLFSSLLPWIPTASQIYNLSS